MKYIVFGHCIDFKLFWGHRLTLIYTELDSTGINLCQSVKSVSNAIVEITGLWNCAGCLHCVILKCSPSIQWLGLKSCPDFPGNSFHFVILF